MGIIRSTPVRLFLMSVALLVAPFEVNGETTLFTEDFEHDLGQWTGKSGGSHTGMIVQDPLASGRGGVLTFTSRKKAGDLFTISPFTSLGPVTVQFDYLGLGKPGSVPDDLGGFVGFSPGLNDGLWIAGTSTLYYPDMYQLIDDGQWHTVSVTIDPPYASYRLMVEDWLESGGIAGDAYFDKISVVVPEPSTWLLAMLAGGTLGWWRKRFQ